MLSQPSSIIMLAWLKGSEIGRAFFIWEASDLEVEAEENSLSWSVVNERNLLESRQNRWALSFVKSHIDNSRRLDWFQDQNKDNVFFSPYSPGASAAPSPPHVREKNSSSTAPEKEEKKKNLHTTRARERSFNNFITISCHLQWFPKHHEFNKARVQAEHWSAWTNISFIHEGRLNFFNNSCDACLELWEVEISNKSKVFLLLTLTRFQFSSTLHWKSGNLCDLI